MKLFGYGFFFLYKIDESVILFDFWVKVKENYINKIKENDGLWMWDLM